MSAGRRRERVRFEPLTETDNGYGGVSVGYDEEAGLTRLAELIYQRGKEASEHGRATGSAVFKVRIPQSTATREITTDWRMRHEARGIEFNITEVDSMTDRKWIWLMVESGQGLSQ